MAWIEYLLDGSRILLSKDFQDALAKLASKLRGDVRPLPASRSFKARLPKIESSRVVDIQSHLEEELVADDVQPEVRADVLLCFAELTQNAFDHGCRSESDQVDITFRIGPASLDVTVKQPIPLPDEIGSHKGRVSAHVRDALLSMSNGGLANILARSHQLRILDSRTIQVFFLKAPRASVAHQPGNEIPGGTSAGSPSEAVSAQKFSCTSDQMKNVIVHAVKGRVNHVNAPEFTEELSRVANDAIHRGLNVVLELSGVDYISSAGLRALAILSKALNVENRRLVVCSATSTVREILDIAKFDRVLAMANDVPEALEALAHEPDRR